jgi:hypothetical protein
MCIMRWTSMSETGIGLRGLSIDGKSVISIAPEKQ